MKIDCECRIFLTEDALYVANDGVPFSRKAVIGICASHLGTKTERTPDDNYDCPDHELPETIQKRQIKKYQRDINDLLEHFGGDTEASRSYQDRTIWELIQNADDALAEGVGTDHLIGAKGLGFRSVLELTEEPEVHSGPFHFRFSEEMTKALLAEMLERVDIPALAFRIPHRAEENGTVSSLIRAGFSTVIRLPYRDGGYDVALGQLNEVVPATLLLCQNTRCLSIYKSASIWKSYRIVSGETGFRRDGDVAVECIESGHRHRLTFRRWCARHEATEGKYHSAAIIMPVGEDGVVTPYDKPSHLHVYFPTDHMLSYKAIVHASFDPDPNRKHIQRGDHTDRARRLLATVFCRVARDIPAKTLLDAFVSDPEKQGDGEIGKLLSELFEIVRETPFVPTIGGSKVKPGDALVWEHSVGDVLRQDAQVVIDAHLVAPELKDRVSKLKMLRSEQLERIRYPELLNHCRNSTEEECRDALKVLYTCIDKFGMPESWSIEPDRKFIARCQDIPCWWTDSKSARGLAANNGVALFQERKAEEPEDLPSWLRCDALALSFLGYWRESFVKGGQASGSARKEFGKALLEWKSENLVHYLLPQSLNGRDEQWWDKNGWDALDQYARWYEPKLLNTDKPSPWGNDKRLSLSRMLRVPTDKGWRPAFECYAGSAWSGPEEFDSFFQEIVDRAVLSSPESWKIALNPDERNEWIGRLRYAGVSWEPKLLGLDEPQPWRDEEQNPFGDRISSGWRDYIVKFREKTSLGRGWKPVEYQKQWAIEYWPDCLGNNKKIAEIVMNLTTQIVGGHDKTETRWQRYSKEPTGKYFDSFAMHQFRMIPWLPCKSALFNRGKTCIPAECWMPNKGLDGLLPEITESRFEEGHEKWAFYEYLTTTLGVRLELPPDGDNKWKEWLEQLSGLVASAREAHYKQMDSATEKLWSRVVKFQNRPDWIDHIQKIPCWVVGPAAAEEKTPEPILEFRNRSEAFWLDKPWMDSSEIKKLLFGAGYPVFLLELGAGTRAHEWFGIKALSTALTVQPRHGDRNGETENQIEQRYQTWHKALEVLASRSNSTIPAKAVQVEVVTELYLQVRIGSQEKSVPVEWWWGDDDDCRVVLDDKDPYRAMGAALADYARHNKLSGTIFSADSAENILRCENRGQVLQRLRNAGIAESELEAFKADPILEPVKPETVTPQPITPTGGEDIVTPPPPRPVVTRPKPEGGVKAQEWLRGRLRDIVGNDGWKVGDRPSEELGGGDIVLTRDGSEIHVEVKHVMGRSVHWNCNQVRKATESRASRFGYWMAVVFEEDDDRVRWLFDPLVELEPEWRNGTVKIVWEGAKITGIPSVDRPWEVPDRAPEIVPTAEHFIIPVSEQIGEGGMRCLLRRLNGSGTNSEE